MPSTNSVNYIDLNRGWGIPLEVENSLPYRRMTTCRETLRYQPKLTRIFNGLFDVYKGAGRFHMQVNLVEQAGYHLEDFLSQSSGLSKEFTTLEFFLSNESLYGDCATAKNKAALSQARGAYQEMLDGCEQECKEHLANTLPEQRSEYLCMEHKSSGHLYKVESKRDVGLKHVGLIFYAPLQGFFIHILLNILIIPRVIKSIVQKKNPLKFCKLLTSDLLHVMMEPVLIICKVACSIVGSIGALFGNPYTAMHWYAFFERGDKRFVNNRTALFPEHEYLSAPFFQPVGKRDENSVFKLLGDAGKRIGQPEFMHQVP